MQKNRKNLGIPFSLLKFLKSFVKVICLVADQFSSYIKNKSSSLIYTYTSMRKSKITIEKSYFCIFDSPYPQILNFFKKYIMTTPTVQPSAKLSLTRHREYCSNRHILTLSAFIQFRPFLENKSKPTVRTICTLIN